MRTYIYRIITEGPKEPLALIVKILLTFLSFIYLAAIRLRWLLYKAAVLKAGRLSSPVISIGNITWGGTGKTPLAESLCRYLASEGKSIALLTRGYGADEDRYLAQSLKGVSVIVGKDRLKNARAALKEKSFDIFILDDGFQHWAIDRDIDIVMINATNPFGSGLLVPSGILREPLTSISRADIAVLTKTDLVDSAALESTKRDISGINPGIEIFESVHRPVGLYDESGALLPVEDINGKKICAVSGLGDNRSFEQTLENIGSDVAKRFCFMDHHRYTEADMAMIIKECGASNIDTIVTTEKDSIKLKALSSSAPDIRWLILKIVLKVRDEEIFLRRLHDILSG